VRYDIRAMAEAATKWVMKKIQTPLVPNNIASEIPAPELIVRASCGATK
jgi:DNA-binding LacI/PurR family transcriptional regulator